MGSAGGERDRFNGEVGYCRGGGGGGRGGYCDRNDFSPLLDTCCTRARGYTENTLRQTTRVHITGKQFHLCQTLSRGIFSVFLYLFKYLFIFVVCVQDVEEEEIIESFIRVYRPTADDVTPEVVVGDSDHDTSFFFSLLQCCLALSCLKWSCVGDNYFDGGTSC